MTGCIRTDQQNVYKPEKKEKKPKHQTQSAAPQSLAFLLPAYYCTCLSCSLRRRPRQLPPPTTPPRVLLPPHSPPTSQRQARKKAWLETSVSKPKSAFFLVGPSLRGKWGDANGKNRDEEPTPRALPGVELQFTPRRAPRGAGRPLDHKSIQTKVALGLIREKGEMPSVTIRLH